MKQELRVLLAVESLTGNGSQKEKQRLISENLSEEMLYILDVCFNPFITTKLHKLDLHQNIDVPEFPGFQTFKELVEDLKKAPAANDSLRSRANSLINSNINEEDLAEDMGLRVILMKILTKRMNIGIGAKLINKAVGKELIPDPSVMLASDDQKEVAGWDKIYCEEKYDGVRVIARGDKNGFQFYTRAFNELDKAKLSGIEAELIKMLQGANIVGEVFFDGELTDLNRKSVSGKVTQILKGTAPDDIDKGFIFHVFDLEKAEADLIDLQEQFKHAQYDLEQTVNRAPADGVIVNVQLRPGAYVAAFPVSSVMTFMEDAPQIYALYKQNELHQIAPGNEAEFYIPSLPGQILKAKVESVIYAEGQGQLNVSGNLPTIGLRDISANRFAVKLVLDDSKNYPLLPAGAVGEGAVYTDSMAFLHVIRKVMLRVATKLNYIIPKLH